MSGTALGWEGTIIACKPVWDVAWWRLRDLSLLSDRVSDFGGTERFPTPPHLEQGDA